MLRRDKGFVSLSPRSPFGIALEERAGIAVTKREVERSVSSVGKSIAGRLSNWR
jgi:hypothetical protein